MPTIDDFICPKEWVSEFMIEVGKMVRKWGEERYVPIRQQVDEHWRDQKVIGLWMGGKGLKTLENARYWYDLETL